jgi:hypothetical protein
MTGSYWGLRTSKCTYDAEPAPVRHEDASFFLAKFATR